MPATSVQPYPFRLRPRPIVRHRPGRRQLADKVTVLALSGLATRGIVQVGSARLPCALGRSGRRARKREGDGGTPVGTWRLLEVLYRADRVPRPRSGLAVRRIGASDGWCDAPDDRNYNRPVRLPYPASAEHLWRADDLYDIVVVVGYNTVPRVRGAGSAIFMHLARAGYRPTEGCVALKRGDMLGLLERVGPRTVLRIAP